MHYYHYKVFALKADQSICIISNVFICMPCIIKLSHHLETNTCKNTIYTYIGKNIIVISFFSYRFIILEEKYLPSSNAYLNEFNRELFITNYFGMWARHYS